MASLAKAFAIASTLLSGAIFGFFYAWVCSTMWGLDQADPRVAIAAMQAMNASVRNALFFPAFFLTPALLGVTALLCLAWRARSAGICFASAAALYVVLGFLLTMTINVPMNEELAVLQVPEDVDSAARAWSDYSRPWQFWNSVRAIACGAVLVLSAIGLTRLPRAGPSI